MLYIPISKTKLDSIKKDIVACEIEITLSLLEPAELASLVFLLKSSSLDFSASNEVFGIQAEKILAELISLANQAATQFVQVAISLVDQVELDVFVCQLNRKGIFFMTEDEVKNRTYLTSDGLWDFNASQTYKTKGLTNRVFRYENETRLFTEDQARVLSAYQAEPDEAMHVQAFAGTGKTKFISLAVETLEAKETLVLALTQQQLKALSDRIQKRLNFLTYGQLADNVIKRSPHLHIPRFWERINTRLTVSFTDLASIMGYKGLSQLSPKRVAEAANQTVTKFCYSTDKKISDQHIPKQFAQLLTVEEGWLLVELARSLWGQITSPNENISLPIRTYHRIKIWALSREPIPREYRFIFVDEAHNLAPPIIEILDNTPQGVVTLGDQYQAIGQEDAMLKGTPKRRHRMMNMSYRVGKNGSGLFNHILSHHPNRLMHSFDGRSNKSTLVQPYCHGSSRVYEAGPCTILARDCWHILRAMLFLKKANAGYYLFPSTQRDLSWLVTDAINLYRNQKRPSHRAFIRHDSWDSFFADQRPDVRSIIEKTIKKGFDHIHFGEAMKYASNEHSPDKFLLAKIEDSKNMEFRRVMLLEDILTLRDDSIYERSLALNLIYLGASRAMDEILVPEQMEGWITDKFG